MEKYEYLVWAGFVSSLLDFVMGTFSEKRITKGLYYCSATLSFFLVSLLARIISNGRTKFLLSVGWNFVYDPLGERMWLVYASSFAFGLLTSSFILLGLWSWWVGPWFNRKLSDPGSRA